MNQIIESYFKAGLNCLPIRKGQKTPLLEVGGVERLRGAVALQDEYSKWELPVAINAGRYSGGVVCIDFDDKGSCFNEWKQLVEDTRSGVIQRLTIEKTPSGGFHCIYKTTADIGNLKLAEKSPNEPGFDKKHPGLIETRGTGGYFVCSPSPGYELIQGSLTKICKASEETHELLISAARALNRKEPVEQAASQPRPGGASGDLTPFDDYDAKNDPISVLTGDGWQIVTKRGDTTYLRRPGKTVGISASWNHIPGRFFCFSSSTDFENGHVYKASAVFAMVRFGGKWSDAAKALYAEGYGSRVAPSVEPKQPQEKPAETTTKSRIIKIESLRESMNAYRQFGLQDNGVSTGWNELDKYYRPARSQFTVITGIPSHGKSEVLDAMMVNVASKSNWRWMVFSPENYPFEMHIRKLIEKKTNKNLSQIKDEEYLEAFSWVDRHFMFIDQSLDGTYLKDVLDETKTIIDSWHPDAIVVDPWNELTHEIESHESETNYIGKQISLARNYARKNDVAFFVIAHPAKMQKDKVTKKYDPPTLYDIAGSAHWYNKCDNGICVYRDFETDTTTVFIQKIKFKMYGKVGAVQFKYDLNSGNYKEIEPEPMGTPDYVHN